MFSQVLTAAALVAGVVARPHTIATRTDAPSFDRWGGFNSLDYFDDFYGKDNFIGLEQSVTVVQDKEVVCRSVDVVIIQQQLAVIREYVKKIITQQICEVETQTVVFSQFQSHFSSFSDDIRRKSHRSVSFDDSIASRIGDIHDGSGELTGHDLGFHGSDIGGHSIVVSGGNWNDATSPSIVDSAFSASNSAAQSSGIDSLPDL